MFVWKQRARPVWEWQAKLFTDHSRHMGRLGLVENMLLLLGLIQWDKQMWRRLSTLTWTYLIGMHWDIYTFTYNILEKFGRELYKGMHVLVQQSTAPHTYSRSAHEHPHKQNQNPHGLITQQGALLQNERTLIINCYSSVVSAHFLAVPPQKQPYFSQLPLNALHRCNRYTLFSPHSFPLAFQLAFPHPSSFLVPVPIVEWH